MSNLAAVPGASGVGIPIQGATTPTIQNTTLTVAGDEYPVAIPDGTKFFTIKARGTEKLQYAYVASESGTNYITIWPGDERLIKNLSTSALTIYVQSSTAGAVVEIESWA